MALFGRLFLLLSMLLSICCFPCWSWRAERGICRPPPVENSDMEEEEEKEEEEEEEEDGG